MKAVINVAGKSAAEPDQIEVIRGLFENALVSMLAYFRTVMDGHEAEVTRLKHALAARDAEIATLRARVLSLQKPEDKS